MIYPLVMVVHLAIFNAFSDERVPFDTFPLLTLAAVRTKISEVGLDAYRVTI